MKVVRPFLIIALFSLLVYLAAVFGNGALVERVRLSNCQNDNMNGAYYAISERSYDRNVSRFLPVNGLTAKTVMSSYEFLLNSKPSFRGSGYSLRKIRNTGALWIEGNGVENRVVTGNGSDPNSISCKVDYSRYSSIIHYRYVPSHPQTTNNQISLYVRMAPVISLLTVTLAGIWFYLWNTRVDAVAIASNYESVVSKGEIWRIFTSSFGHLTLLHVGMNVSTLLSLVPLEMMLGHIRFFVLNLWLVVITQVVLLFLTWLLNRWGIYQGKSVWGLGYSCVLFALVTWSILLGDTRCPVSLFGRCIPTYVISFPFTIKINMYPFMLLLLMKLLIPSSSFLGHLAGILCGILLSTKFSQILTPVTCCISVELIYIAFHLYREKHKTSSLQSRAVGHMVNSDTNVKYVIVHNISFILLFASSLCFIVSSFFNRGIINVMRIQDSILIGLTGCVLCFCIKRYTRDGCVAGILVVHFVSSIVMLAESLALCSWYHVKSFDSLTLSNEMKSEGSLLWLCSAFSILSLLCVLDMMKSLSFAYSSWFNSCIKFLLEPTKGERTYIVNGFVFRNTSARYQSLSQV